MRTLSALLFPALTLSLLAATANPARAIGAFAHWQATEDMDTGLGLGLKHKFQVVPVFSAEARGAWVRVDGEDDFADVDMFPLELIGRAKILLLYVGAGVGYYLFSGDDFAPKNSFGGAVLGGAELTLFGLGAFLEGRYQILEPDEEDQVGGTRNLNGFGATLGVIVPIG